MATRSREGEKTTRAARAPRAARFARVAFALAIAAASLAIGGEARAESWRDHYRASRAAHARGDFREERARLAIVADSIGEQPGVSYALAAAAARLGERDEALRRLRLYAAAGVVREAWADSDFVSLWGDAEFRAVSGTIRAHGDSIGSARLHHRFADAALLTEDLAHDPKTRSFFVTSITRGAVIEIDANGEERLLEDPGARPGWGAFAACVDPRRRLLWTSVAATAQTIGYDAADSGRTALVAWDLEARRPVRRLEWPRDGRPHLFGDLTVGPDGAVYVSDGPAGALRVLRAGKDTIETLVGEGGFDSPQGPALAADGVHLYVADYSRGVARVDLRSGARTWMPFAPGLAVQGIDGLAAHGRDLIAVQNGTRPRRVARLRLDRAGERIVSASPLESGTVRLGEPTHGVVVGSRFWFLANTGWDRVEEGPLEAGSAAPPAIWRLDLGAP